MLITAFGKYIHTYIRNFLSGLSKNDKDHQKEKCSRENDIENKKKISFWQNDVSGTD